MSPEDAQKGVTMRSALSTLLAPVATVLLIILFGAAAALVPGGVSATDPGSMDAMSIDMDPSADVANTATGLGSREPCARVNENDILDADEDATADTVTIDVTAKAIPDSNRMTAFQLFLLYDEANLTIQSRDLQFMLLANPGGNLFDASDFTPDVDGNGQYTVAGLDVNDMSGESGDGVLARITVSSDPAASAGLYSLALDSSVHLDPSGEGHIPATINNAFLAVNETCDNLPTPSPAPTPGPTPSPGSVLIGIDHDGAPLDINPGPSIVGSGDQTTVAVVAEAPSPGIGAFTVDIYYDPNVLTATSCTSSIGLCNVAFSSISVRAVGASATGFQGTLDLADITFQAVGSDGECSALTPDAVQVTDPEGTDLGVTVFDGVACVSAGPGPGSVFIGIDHDGAPLDINPGPSIVGSGAQTTVAVVAEAPSPGIGAFTVDIYYDPSVLTATSCTSSIGLCNVAYSSISVRAVGASAFGFEGTVDLADITFEATGPVGWCSGLDPNVVTLADPEGTDLAASVFGGGVCISAPCPTPANDDFDAATGIPGIPFSDSVDTRCGTTAPDDPYCAGRGTTVWYSFTPSENLRIQADTFGSSYDTTLSVYTGARGALNQIRCNDDSGSLQSKVVFDAMAGETYYFMIGSCCGGPGGDLVFTVDLGPPPLDVQVDIDPVGSVVPRYGVAYLEGTVSCNKPAAIEIFGQLNQRSGRATIVGDFSTFLLCDGEARWSAAVDDATGKYAGGQADATVSAFGFTMDEFDSDESVSRVRLEGTRPPPKTRCPRDGNLGFESGTVGSSDIPCWTVVQQAGSAGSWCTQVGAAPPQGDCAGTTAPVAVPPAGAQAAMTNQSFMGSYVLFRCGVLRTGSIEFNLYVNNHARVFFTPPTLDYTIGENQQFRADLVSAAAMAADPFTVAPGDVLMNLYQTMPGDPLVSGYAAVNRDASAQVGEEVCIRFAVTASVFFMNVGVDDVGVDLSTRGRP